MLYEVITALICIFIIEMTRNKYQVKLYKITAILSF